MTKTPKLSFGKVRMDSALNLDDEYEIQLDYEPLILKLICWGETRHEAIENLSANLDLLCINGTGTNIDFLMAVIDSDIFRQNKHTTKLLESEEFLRQMEMSADLIARWRPTRSVTRNIGILN